METAKTPPQSPAASAGFRAKRPSRADAEWIPHPAQFIEKGRSINGLPQRRGIQTNGSPWAQRRPPFPTSPVKFAAQGAGRTDAALRLPVVFETAKTPPQSPAANAGWFRANRAVQGGYGMDSATGAVHRKGPVDRRFAATPGIQTKDFSLSATPAALPGIAREIRRAGRGSHWRGIALAISAAMQSGVHGGMRQPAVRDVDGNCGMRVISKARLFMAMTPPLRRGCENRTRVIRNGFADDLTKFHKCMDPAALTRSESRRAGFARRRRKRRFMLPKNSRERERAEALSRSQSYPATCAAGGSDFCVWKSHFPEQNW